MEILSSMPRLKRQNAMRSTGEKEKKKKLGRTRKCVRMHSPYVRTCGRFDEKSRSSKKRCRQVCKRFYLLRLTVIVISHWISSQNGTEMVPEFIFPNTFGGSWGSDSPCWHTHGTWLRSSSAYHR